MYETVHTVNHPLRMVWDDVYGTLPTAPYIYDRYSGEIHPGLFHMMLVEAYAESLNIFDRLWFRETTVTEKSQIARQYEGLRELLQKHYRDDVISTPIAVW